LSAYLYIRRGILKKYIALVLTYHRITDTPQDNISTSRDQFARQISYLIEGYEVTSLDILIKKTRYTCNLQKDIISITFDDGYADVYDNAFPTLRSQNLPATIFLISDYIGRSGMLCDNKIQEMAATNFSIGSHTRSHVILSNIDEEALCSEILTSRDKLSTTFDRDIKYFAYPQGKTSHFNNRVLQYVQDSGYSSAFTMVNGTVTNTSDPFQIPRIGIRDCPSYVFKVRTSGLFELPLLLNIRKLFNFC
jgi:peptidoglycan/xylan/chitin deacetylase (PgdA/CDA1 family)